MANVADSIRGGEVKELVASLTPIEAEMAMAEAKGIRCVLTIIKKDT